MRLGVRHRDGELVAHAWVGIDGMALEDTRGLLAFGVDEAERR